jgi:effector-binding domain-containing protein
MQEKAPPATCNQQPATQQGTQSMTYRVQIRQTNPQPILSIRAVVPTLELVGFFDEATIEMKTYLAQVRVSITGPAMSLWHSAPGEIENASDIETCWPVAGPAPASGRMRYRELPAGLEAFTVHAGSYDTMGAAFDAIWNWIQEQGYEMDGPPRDVVLVGPNDTPDPEQYRTEIVYPVRRRG